VPATSHVGLGTAAVSQVQPSAASRTVHAAASSVQRKRSVSPDPRSSVTPGAKPSASSASARWTVASCSIRRGQKRARRSAPHDHIGASGSAARSTVSSSTPPIRTYSG
jgi:hypothetical protein